jgi:hypothetical protein
MGVKLGAGLRVELRWWWEDRAEGEVVEVRGPIAARALAASLATRADAAAALRSFLARASGLRLGPPDGRDLVDRLAHEIAAGHVRVSRIAAAPLVAFGAEVAEDEPVAAAPAPAPAPEEEPVCWPCLLAEASANALREAAIDGTPFVAQD